VEYLGRDEDVVALVGSGGECDAEDGSDWFLGSVDEGCIDVAYSSIECVFYGLVGQVGTEEPSVTVGCAGCVLGHLDSVGESYGWYFIGVGVGFRVGAGAATTRLVILCCDDVEFQRGGNKHEAKR